MVSRIKQLRLISIALLIVSINAAIGAYIYYYTYSKTIIANTEKRFTEILIDQTLRIGDYLAEKITALEQLAQSKEIQQAFKEKNIIDNQQLKAYVSSYLNEHNFKNLLLIRLDGSIIFSNRSYEEFASVNLLKSPYDKINLGQFFSKARMTLSTAVTTYLEIDYVLQEPSLYSITPVFASGQLEGFVAVHINPDHIFAITNNYFGLGQSGEIVIGYLIHDGAQIVSRLRNDPEKSFGRIEFIPGGRPSLLEKAVLGQEGFGVQFDYRSVEVVSAWGYEPVLGWGIVIKMDKTEVLEPARKFLILFYALSIFSFILLIITCALWKHSILSRTKHGAIYTIFAWLLRLRILIGLLLIANICFIGMLMWRYMQLRENAMQQAHNLSQSKIQNAADIITRELEKVAQRAQSLSDDLSAGRLKKEDILIRLRRDVQENPILSGFGIAYAPYAYDTGKKLYAPFVVRASDRSLEEKSIESLYDYTAERQDTHWFTKPFTQGAMWFQPDRYAFNTNFVARYVVPFYKQNDKSELAGVVIADYDVERINTLGQKLAVGETGYAFIINQTGRYIYSPDKDLVTKEKTIFNQAQEQVNQELYNIGTAMVKTTAGITSYTDSITNNTVWIHFNKIPLLNWTLGLVFLEKEVDLASNVIRHMLIWVLVSILSAIILFLFLFYELPSRNIYTLRKFAIALTMLFFAALIAMFFIIQGTLEQKKDSREVIITSEVGLQAYFAAQQARASIEYKKIIAIPTGILLDSLTFPDAEHVSFAGIMWQKYPKDNKDIERGFYIPGTTELSVQEESRKIEGDYEVISWKIRGLLYHDYAFEKYPFDQHTISIPIFPKTNRNTILLVPALMDYRIMGNSIGIARGLTLPDFSIERTFFSFLTSAREIVSGNGEQEIMQSIPQLQFNIIIYRRIINAFIVYFIPMMIVLFSLFAIFVKTSVADMATMVSRMISAYSGLLFALIVLHAGLRGTYKESSFLYIEYLFFLSYITILLFIIQVLFISKNKKVQEFFEKLMVFIRLFFWPVQLACWFIATIVVFYR
ncbi:MAG TPA: cache domain-containing protein [Candidatus Dependentiae bacterium]|mgnify:CR=1 FL=1|nr:cache domain-containing protein [Candidatus Dependentiae bacterium]HRQ62879.1 cache domain-containing protein [Candidatus Dependentiae bacterium]